MDRWGREGAAVAGVRPSERRGIKEQSRSCRLSGLEKDWAAEIARAVWRGVTMAAAGAGALQRWSKGTQGLSVDSSPGRTGTSVQLRLSDKFMVIMIKIIHAYLEIQRIWSWRDGTGDTCANEGTQILSPGSRQRQQEKMTPQSCPLTSMCMLWYLRTPK